MGPIGWVQLRRVPNGDQYLTREQTVLLTPAPAIKSHPPPFWVEVSKVFLRKKLEKKFLSLRRKLEKVFFLRKIFQKFFFLRRKLIQSGSLPGANCGFPTLRKEVFLFAILRKEVFLHKNVIRDVCSTDDFLIFWLLADFVDFADFDDSDDSADFADSAYFAYFADFAHSADFVDSVTFAYFADFIHSADSADFADFAYSADSADSPSYQPPQHLLTVSKLFSEKISPCILHLSNLNCIFISL